MISIRIRGGCVPRLNRQKTWVSTNHIVRNTVRQYSTLKITHHIKLAYQLIVIVTNTRHSTMVTRREQAKQIKSEGKHTKIGTLRKLAISCCWVWQCTVHSVCAVQQSKHRSHAYTVCAAHTTHNQRSGMIWQKKNAILRRLYGIQPGKKKRKLRCGRWECKDFLLDWSCMYLCAQ